MPVWIYEIPPLQAALLMVLFVETFALGGLFLARRFFVRRLRYHEGYSEAVSGTVQAIGVFYGITVGLIAAGVWSTNSTAAELVSKEATAIASLHRDLGGYPAPLRDELQAQLRKYTVFIIETAWPAQVRGQGQVLFSGGVILDEFQEKLYTFEPATPGQIALHGETLKAYNQLLEYRRLRIDAVGSGMSSVMWAVIWVGAVISIGVAYLYKIEDPRLHATLVALMGGFLSMVLFMIIVNDRPFYGYVSVSSDPYQMVLERVIDRPR